jgi:Cu/Ag efflux protein CusF
MRHLLTVLLFAFAGTAVAQPDGVQKGKVKKIDPDKLTITITQDGKDRDFLVTKDTRVFGAEDKELKDRLKTIKEGAEVMFKPERRDGKDVLVGLKPADAKAPPPKIEKVDTSKLKALIDLGKEKYQGYEGGLYPGGKNERPADHEKAGVALAKKVQPLDADGKPSADGKVVLLSVGMSNTSQESEGFRRLLEKEAVNPKLQFVNGAQNGMTAKAIQDPDDRGSGSRYWKEVDRRLKDAGVTRAQVQAVWIKEADANPREGFPKYAETLESELAKIVRLLPERFPNVKLVYLSSRTFGGYATTPLNPEPYAYESGFSVKWLIEKQIKGDASLNYDPAKGDVKAPWLSWGPYLWANGNVKNANGLTYQESDFGIDGTHPSPAGVTKVAKEMLTFFKTDATAKPWFVKQR